LATQMCMALVFDLDSICNGHRSLFFSSWPLRTET
jgi:hypothetical protein